MQKRWMAAMLCLLVGMLSLAPAVAEEAADGDMLGYVAEMDKNTVMTVEITVDPDVWQEMLDNAGEEEYVPADITINGVTVENVGIRPKGNSSLRSVVGDDTTDRYSFKIKFDKYEYDQTWLGLDKLVLNNMYSDATYMKEYLSYDIMSAIGVDTSLYAYAAITVNGETWGLYFALEDVEYSYLERIKDGEGEIYKPDTMGDMGGGGARPEGGGQRPEGEPAQGGEARQTREAGGNGGNGGGGRGGFGGMTNSGVALLYTDDDEASYAAIFDNEKTKTDSEDHQRVIEAIQHLNAGEDLETYVDVDQMLRYIAGHTVVVNLDSYSSGMAHNYLLYENDGQLSMIPWDYNEALGGMQSRDGTSVINFPIDTPVSGVSMEDRPMFSKLLEVPEYLAQYHTYMQELVDTYFADDGFAAKVDELDAMISAYVEDDPTAFYTYEEYRTAIETLKELGTLRGESIQGQLDGTIPSTTEGQEAEPEKLIDGSSITLSDMGGHSGGGFGGGGGGFGGEENMEDMRKVMEILEATGDGELTDAQREEIAALGISEEQLTQMQQMMRQFTP